jgi:hypothetical protein
MINDKMLGWVVADSKQEAIKVLEYMLEQTKQLDNDIDVVNIYAKKDESREVNITPEMESTREASKIPLRNRKEAMEVLISLEELIEKYGFVSLSDYYDLCGKPSEFTDNKYGWKDMKRTAIAMNKYGYILELPKATLLEVNETKEDLKTFDDYIKKYKVKIVSAPYELHNGIIYRVEYPDGYVQKYNVSRVDLLRAKNSLDLEPSIVKWLEEDYLKYLSKNKEGSEHDS